MSFIEIKTIAGNYASLNADFISSVSIGNCRATRITMNNGNVWETDESYRSVMHKLMKFQQLNRKAEVLNDLQTKLDFNYIQAVMDKMKGKDADDSE